MVVPWEIDKTVDRDALGITSSRVACALAKQTNSSSRCSVGGENRRESTLLVLILDVSLDSIEAFRPLCTKFYSVRQSSWQSCMHDARPKFITLTLLYGFFLGWQWVTLLHAFVAVTDAPLIEFLMAQRASLPPSSTSTEQIALSSLLLIRYVDSA